MHSLPSLRTLNALIPASYKRIDPVKGWASIAFALAVPTLCIWFGLQMLPAPDVTSWQAVLLWTPLSVAIGVGAGGLWVLGHEAGHGLLVRPYWLEQLLGLLFHTLFLVPYFAWRRTHQLHHLHTNCISGDVAFVPKMPDSAFAVKQERLRKKLGERTFNGLFQGIMYLFGFLLYLGSSLPGERHWFGRFIPLSDKTYPSRRLKWLIGLNTLIYAGWLGIIVYFASVDFSMLLFLYILPLTVINAWLVVYTMLQHSSVDVPWYDGESWTPSNGAFAAVDRGYWWLTNILHFNVGRYHVYHHINCAIPQYHGKAVTELLASHYPEAFRFSQEHPFRAAWRQGRYGLVARRVEPHHFWYE